MISYLKWLLMPTCGVVSIIQSVQGPVPAAPYLLSAAIVP